MPASLTTIQYCGALDYSVSRVRKKRIGSFYGNSDNVAACLMNQRTPEHFGGGHGHRAILLESSPVPQKVQPTIFDDRGVQLQRQEVVVEDSDRTAGVDIQENQRPLHEARSLPTGCRPLVCRGGRRRVGGREDRLHHQSSQRCQPQGGPLEHARWGFGHLLGLQSGRISARNEAVRKTQKTAPATFDGVSVPQSHRSESVFLSSFLTPSAPRPSAYFLGSVQKSARPEPAFAAVRARSWEEEKRQHRPSKVL